MTIAIPQLEELDVVFNEESGAPHLQAKYTNWRSKGVKQDEMTLSDGTLRLLALLWALLDARGPLLLEEPELSLHDAIVEKLPNMFAKILLSTKKKLNQLVISTHSESLLRDTGILPEDVLRFKTGKEGTEILTVDANDRQSMEEDGLTAADVLLPKTAPEQIHQLSLFEL